MGKDTEIAFRSRNAARRAIMALLCAIMIVALVGCQTTDGRRKSCLFNQSCGNEPDERAQSPDMKSSTANPPKPPETEPATSLAAQVAPSASAAPAAESAAPQFYGHTDAATSRAPAQNDVANNFFNSTVKPIEAPSAQAEPSYQLQPQTTQPQLTLSPQPSFKSYGPASPAQTFANPQNDKPNDLGYAPETQDYSAQLPAEIKAATSLFGFEEQTALPDFAPLPSEFNAPYNNAAPNSSDMVPPVELKTDNPEAKVNVAALQLRNSTILSETVAPKVAYLPETRSTDYAQPTNVIAAQPQPQMQTQTAAYPSSQNVQPAAPAVNRPISNLQPSQNFPGQYVGGVLDGSRPRAVQM